MPISVTLSRCSESFCQAFVLHHEPVSCPSSVFPAQTAQDWFLCTSFVLASGLSFRIKFMGLGAVGHCCSPGSVPPGALEGLAGK